MRYLKILCILVLTISPLLVACSSDDDDDSTGSSMFGLGAAAVESLPQIRDTTKKSKAVIAGNIEAYNTLSSFFKLECFMPDSDNFCPEGVDTSGGDTNPFKLTSYTLIGSIYHADMYSGGLKTECEGTEATIAADSFVAAEVGGDPDKFILNYFDLLTCVKQETGEDLGTGTKYQTYSIDGGGAYQATLTTRYRNPYNGDADPGQNDIFQVYVGLNGGEPTLLAFNYAGADSMFQRTVLLVNTVTHKFAVKHFQNGTPDTYLVAIGVGGVDRETGQLNPGHYYTIFTKNDGAEDCGCVDNATGDFELDNSECNTASIPFDAAWVNEDSVADYLEMTADDQTRLAAFLAKFSTDDPLVAGDSPADNTTDPEQNFPYSIE